MILYVQLESLPTIHRKAEKYEGEQNTPFQLTARATKCLFWHILVT